MTPSPEDLMYLLARLLQKPPMSIEILPGDTQAWMTDTISESSSSRSTTPFLYIEGNLGIPQKALHQAYLTAIAVFRRARKVGARSAQPSSDATVVDLNSSSIVILIANPAHQTALNARKRLIQQGQLDSAQELAMIASVLSNPDCSKQSILWHHRRWLLQHIYRGVHSERDITGSVGDMVVHLPLQVLQQELDIISRACDLYPRNYYAWTHWQLCLRALVDSVESYLTVDDRSRHMHFAYHELARLKNWIDGHISDYTAIHHICSFVLHVRDLDLSIMLSDNSENGGMSSRFVDPTTYLDHAISLVSSYPDHEALWMYLRGAYCIQDRTNSSEILAAVVQDSHYAYRFLIWRSIQGGCLHIDNASARGILTGDSQSQSSV